MLKIICPCGTAMTSDSPSSLIRSTQQHCAQFHATEVPAETILAATITIPDSPRHASRLILEIAEAVAGAVADRSSTGRTSLIAGMVREALRGRPGATQSPAEPIRPPLSPKGQHSASPRSLFPKAPAPPPKPTVNGGDAQAQERLNEQKKMREQADYVRWAEQMQSIQHQMNMGINRNIV